MSLESDLFRYFKPEYDLLEPYGFVRKESSYFYSAPLLNGQFKAIIEVDGSGKVSGRVIDTDLEEDYTLFRSASRNGYASEVREAYLDLLKKMVVGCFKAMPFISRQGNMIYDYVNDEYNDTPDKPFRKLEDCSVIRNHNNLKWYGLIMVIPKNKLTGESEDKVEVINLKVKPENYDMYVAMEDIYPAYHMNKKNWVSVILDSSVSDELLLHMVDESYSFTEYARDPGLSNDDWLLPANPQYFDVLGAFRDDPVLSWHPRKRMKVNDNVYIYYAAPYSSIVLKARVIAVEADGFTSLEAIEFYDPKRYPLNKLKENGLKTVRFINKLPNETKEYLERN